MLGLERFLTFAEITFPVFLLVPPLITSFKILVLPTEMARFFFLLWADYVVITTAAGWLVITSNDCAWLPFVFLAVSGILVVVSLFYITRWTLQEQTRILIDRLSEQL